MPTYRTSKLMGELLELAVAQTPNAVFDGIEVRERYPHCFDAHKTQPWCPKWKGTLVITGETEEEALLRCGLYSAVGDSIHLDVPFEYVTHYELRVFRDGIEQGQSVQLPFTIAQTNAFNYILHEQGVLLQDAYEMCRVWSRMGKRGQPTYRYKPVLPQTRFTSNP